MRTFVGSTYDLGRPETIGALRSVLEQIILNLPSDPGLRIAEVNLHEGKLRYVLVDGIIES